MAADDAPVRTTPADPAGGDLAGGDLAGGDLADAIAAVREVAGSQAGSDADAAGSAADTAASDAAHRKAWRGVLLDVHEALMRARVAGGSAVPVELAVLGDVLQAAPEAALRRLPPRERIALELLRGDFTEPAWLLAHDNASGQITPERSVATWAGRSALRDPLPVPFVIEEQIAYAFLPGFRDPRWQVPDDVYRVPVGVDSLLDEVRFEGGRLTLSGAASLTLLPTEPDDTVTLLLRGPEKREVRVAATRSRRPDLGLSRGAERDRLAWSGWSLAAPVSALAEQLGPVGRPTRWQLLLEITQQGLTRRTPLGTRRGPTAPVTATGLAPFVGEPVVAETSSCAVTLAAEPATAKYPGQLVLRVSPLSRAARIVPRPLRKLARSVVATIDEKVDRAVDGPR